MSRLVLIANPAASGFTGGLHRGVVRILRPRYEVEATWPRTAAEASELAAEAAQRGVEVVAAMGGDGILHDVVQSLAGTTTALGIIPAGTTNVLARLLGVPLRPGRAARLLAGEHLVRTEPAIRLILHRDRTADRALAVFATGLGFDAEVVAAADAEPYRKYRFGWAHYTRTTLELAWSRFRQRPPHLRVIEAASPSRRDGRRADAAGVMVQFRRAYTYLGRVPLRLSTALPDPMTVLVVESLPARRAPWIAAGAMLGHLGSVKGMAVWEKVEGLTVEADPPVSVQADGEHLGSADRVEAALLREAFRVVAPVSPG